MQLLCIVELEHCGLPTATKEGLRGFGFIRLLIFLVDKRKEIKILVYSENTVQFQKHTFILGKFSAIYVTISQSTRIIFEYLCISAIEEQDYLYITVKEI